MQVPTNNLQGTGPPESDGEQFLSGLSHSHLLMALAQSAKAAVGSWSDPLRSVRHTSGMFKGTNPSVPGMTQEQDEATHDAQAEGITKIGRGQIDPKAFEEDVLMMPKSSNVEDRRGTDQIKQLYQLGVGRASQTTDMSQAEEISNALRKKRK